MLAGYLFPITLILGFVARLFLFSIKPLLLIFGAAKLYELIQKKRGNSWSPEFERSHGKGCRLIGLRERKTVFRVPGVRLGCRPVSSWGGDQVGSRAQVDRSPAPRLPLSAPKIRARARPASFGCLRAGINERKPSSHSFSDAESKIKSHTFGPDAHHLQWPLFWDELCRCPGTAHG